MKLRLECEYVTYQFIDDEGTYYRTSEGIVWEELMGESWEPVYIGEKELREAYIQWKQFNDIFKEEL